VNGGVDEKAELGEVSPVEAKKLLDSGFSYVDVRTQLEFQSAHPEGAINVPFVLRVRPGEAQNPDFVRLIERRFAATDGLVLGCATGVRSRAAAELLRQSGFTRVVEMPAGFEGKRGAFGAVVAQGWRACGLPVATGDDEGS